MVAAGVIRTSPKSPFDRRLLEIGTALRGLIREHAPEFAAVEEVFHAVNAKTALKLAHVRGVALLTIAEAGVVFAEYSPLEVKMSVVGYGRAEKCQVQMMVQSLLRLPEVDRQRRRLGRAGHRHLSRHARSHQPPVGLAGYV